uniref:Uncharacterized protein n=1 Tax=Arundo donax TaxID=35708 RepID=A0A0A8ZSH2_ARUDO
MSRRLSRRRKNVSDRKASSE